MLHQFRSNDVIQDVKAILQSDIVLKERKSKNFNLMTGRHVLVQRLKITYSYSQRSVYHKKKKKKKKNGSVERI